MPFIETPIADLLIFEPNVWQDERGYFFESYNEQSFAAAGLTYRFVQDNEAKSTKGVLRGLHFQRGEAAQAKLANGMERSSRLKTNASYLFLGASLMVI